MQTSRRSILKGSILASLAGTMGATAMSASAAEKQAALPKKEYDLVICGLGIGGIVTAIRAAQDGLKPVSCLASTPRCSRKRSLKPATP